MKKHCHSAIGWKAIITLFSLCVFLIAASAVLAGTDVKVNQDSGIDLQNEISLVQNPANPSNLVAAYNDDADNNGGFDTGPGIGISYSTNSGATWSTTHTPSSWGQEFDPSVTADTSGNIYAGHISSTATWWWPTANTAVLVSRSGNGGVTWTQPTTVEAFSGNGITPVPYLDKDYVACDTFVSSLYKDRLYVVWQRDSTTYPYSEIYSSYSINQATSFSAPLKVNDQPQSSSLANAAVPAVTPDGTVCVAWVDTSSLLSNPAQTTATIYFDRSTDGGNNFGKDTTVVANFVTPHRLPNQERYPTSTFTAFRANPFPSIATDPTNSNYIYLAYTSDPDGPIPGPSPPLPYNDSGDIYFVRSTDGGQTWSTPNVVNDDGSPGKGQFSPWLSVTPSGTVCVAWYDRRNDPTDIDYDVYYAISTDKGVSFSANKQVNDVNNTLLANPSSWIGEYLGSDTDNSYAYFAWTDTRNGERDIYFDKISFSAAPQPPSTPTYYFPWYDDLYMQTWILVGNASTTQAAVIDLYLGSTQKETSYTIAAGGRQYFRYNGLMDGPVKVVSKNGAPIFTTQRSLYSSSFCEIAGIPSTSLDTSYYFPWYDDLYMQTWVLVGNPSTTQTVQIDLFVGSMQRENDYVIPAGGRQYFRYNGVMDGPTRIVANRPVFVTQRSLYPGTGPASFSEVAGLSNASLDMTYYFPWYDCLYMQTWILVGNPDVSASVPIDLYIGSAQKENGYSIPAGGRAYFKYDGLMDGPVRVVSPSGMTIFTTQRSLYSSSFCEVPGIAASSLAQTYFLPWYDDLYMQTWVLVGNASTTSTALVDLFIGSSQKENNFSLSPGGRQYFRYNGLMDGPVKVVSDNGVPLFSTQRSIYATSFWEIPGIKVP